MMIRSPAQSGKNVLRSNAVQLTPPGVATARQTRKDRWQRHIQSWRRPNPMILGGIALRDFREPRLPHVTISISDRGFLRTGRLVLVVEREDGSR